MADLSSLPLKERIRRMQSFGGSGKASSSSSKGEGDAERPAKPNPKAGAAKAAAAPSAPIINDAGEMIDPRTGEIVGRFSSSGDSEEEEQPGAEERQE